MYLVEYQKQRLEQAPTHQRPLMRLWVLAAQLGVSRLVWGVYALFTFIVWGLLGVVSYQQYQQAGDGESNRAVLNAKGFAEYVGLNIFVIDRLMIDLRDGYQRGVALPAQARIAAELGDIGPVLQQVAIANAAGDIVASTLPMTGKVSIADRKHFLAVANDPRERLFISEPVIGRVSKRMSLQLVRPILDEQGRFQGAIVGSIDPTLLQQYFRNYDALSDDGVVSIAGLDGITRLRMHGESITWGQDLSKSVRWPELTTRDKGSYRATSTVDGADRVYAYQRVGSYPLTVVVGYAAPTFWRSLEETHVFALSLVISATLLFALLAYMISQLSGDQRQLISQLRASRAKALEANQMKSNFLASVSHELRTPLNSILGFSELIRELSMDPTVYKYADLINRSGKHLHSLVSTVLDLAKIEAGRMEVQLEDIDMRDLLSAIVEVHQVSADKKKLALSLTLPPGKRITAHSDRTKLVQVLNNVLHNAIKFTHTGGIFVTGTLQSDNSLLISVIDTGIGIAPDRLAHVFDRFNTIGDAKVQQEDRGSGLGLALSKDLMDLIGGNISITSDPGFGTHVNITIPEVRSHDA